MFEGYLDGVFPFSWDHGVILSRMALGGWGCRWWCGWREKWLFGEDRACHGDCIWDAATREIGILVRGRRKKNIWRYKMLNLSFS